MKYYIPTSSLNLDNILQSECILPISHYDQRISGYKKYEQIKELRGCNEIVLFKYPVSFQINDTERINYPLLLEFEDDVQTSELREDKSNKGICFCDHPLVITPDNCNFYFFSDQALKVTTVNTRDYKAIKYYEYYTIGLLPNEINQQSRPLTISLAEPRGIIESKEIVVDKLKGGIYGYLLGEYNSVSLDLACMMRLTQELYDVLTNLMTCPSAKGSFSKRLSSLLFQYAQIDKYEAKKAKAIKDGTALCKMLITDLCKRNFKKFCEHLDELIQFRKTLHENKLPSVEELNTKTDFEQLRNKIEIRTDKAVLAYREKKVCPKFASIQKDCETLIIPAKNSSLVKAVVKYIIEVGMTLDILIEKRSKCCYDILSNVVVPEIKKRLGDNDKWNESEERDFINSLVRKANDPGSVFDINSTKSIELKSIALIILSGERYEDCMALCKKVELDDYRLVTTLWGCLCGYMEMNREYFLGLLSKKTSSKAHEILEVAYKKYYRTKENPTLF